MDPNLDARLSAIEKKLDEAMTILSGMRRTQRTASVMRWLYWVLIIGLGIASIYLIQPYIEQLGAAYGLTQGEGGDTQSGGYGDLLNQLKQYQENQ